MKVAPLALITGLLPLICVHTTYLIAASHGHVDWCVPYWDSCTSISATGRQLPEKVVFKFIMLPTGVLILLFWWVANQWLEVVGGRRSRAMQLTGSVAALFMMLYVVALGEAGDMYRTMRRIGIILFFSLSFVAQLIFLKRYNDTVKSPMASHQSVVGWQRRAAAMLLAIGISSVILDMTYANYDDIEDAFEWVMMLFVVAQFCSHYLLWRSVGLRVTISAER